MSRFRRTPSAVATAGATLPGVAADALPVRRTTSVGSYSIQSLESGATGDVLLLLHGLSGSGRWWSRNIPGLARDHRVMIPDLVGFGRTPLVGRVPGLAAMADLIAAWLLSLIHISSPRDTR